MNIFSPSQLAFRLAERAESVCRELLPKGRRRYGRWECGSVMGEEGASLKVELSGERRGVWGDFATGDGGDLLDLWSKVRGISIAMAMREVASFLNIHLDGEPSMPRREFRSPEKPACRSALKNDAMHAWLQSRGLTDETVRRYGLAVNERGELILPYIKKGVFVNAKYRTLPKTFRQEQGARPILFGWNVLESLYPNTRSVTIAEGEMDAMTFTQYGFPALSVPIGGGGGNKQSWIDEDFDDLMQFDTIYIATDMDEAGHRAADEITRRLGSERCRRVQLPYKDANECLMRGVPVEVIRDAIRTAKTNDPDELKRAGHFTEDVMDVFAGNGLGATGVRCPWGRDEFRLRPSELTIVSGYSGSGKSTLLAQLAIDGMTQGTRWCKASMEMPARVTLAGMVQTIAQTLTPSPDQIKTVMKWMDERLWMFDVRGTAQADRMMTVFEYAAKRYAIQYYTIDSLAKCGMAEDDYNGQKLFAERLTDFNHTYGASSLLVAHSRKQESETIRPRKHDVRGATAITDMADNVMMVWRDKSENSDNKTEIIIDKQRMTGWEGTLQLHYDPSCRQFLYGSDGPKDYMRLLS